ncbi:MAG: PhoH family protein [Clostridia bacterium]|nr:PhoH family protein [Clostridia bacterium]
MIYFNMTQTDLLFGKKSGLSVATRILRGIDGIGVHTFTEHDVVRHRIVRQIIQAYDKYDSETRSAQGQRKTYNAQKNLQTKGN